MLVTTIKNAKQFLWLTFSIMIIFSGDLVANPKTPLQRGIEAKEAGKLKQAKGYFESIKPEDPDYGLALDELADVAQMQEAERESRNSRFVAERLVEKLDKGAEKCLKLIKEDGSPEVHQCVQEMSTLQTEVSAKLQTAGYENPTLKEVVTLVEPFKKFDAVALPVTNVRPSREDMDRASDKVMALESYIQDPNNPPNLVALGAFVLSQFHLGGAKAHAKDCDYLMSGELRHSEQARTICGYAEQATARYADILRQFDPRTLIDGKPMPSRTWDAVAPIEVSDLPRPEVIATRIPVIEDQKEAVPSKKKKKKKSTVVSSSSFGSSVWTSPLIVYGVPVGVAVATGMYWMMRTPPQVAHAKTLAQAWRLARTDAALLAVTQYAAQFGITVTTHGQGQFKTLFATVAGTVVGISPSAAIQMCTVIKGS